MSDVFKFQFDPYEDVNVRVARCAKEVLSKGPMGNTLQHDYYKEFISCSEKIDLSSVHTSCGIFVRAVLYHCGLFVPNAKVGQALIGGWVPLTMQDSSWVKYKTVDKTLPNVGSIFFIQSKSKPNNCHVGIFIKNLGKNEWETAEGGGGDGTKCSINERELGIYFDKYGRNLRGWFDTSKIGLPE